MMSFKEFKATCTAKVAGPHQETKSKISDLPTTSSTFSASSSTLSSTQEELPIKMCKMFAFIDDTYKDLRRFTSSPQKNLNGSQLMQTINKYKNGCNEIYVKALDSYDMCHKLAQNIVRTMDIFKELCTCISDLEEYNYRLCEIMSIFIMCELRLSVDAGQQEHLLIAHRIIYIMRRHLIQEEEQETLFNILRTLVYIPKLFNARDIMCAIFGEFIPIKPVLEVKVLPDKLYMLYIIVFYRWMMMQKDDDDKILIVNFAESFMKPSVSLCSNNLYGAYMPMYTTHSTATRTILNNLKYYRDIRNASIIDNALKKIGTVVNLCDDEEDDIIIVDTSPTTDFVEVFASTRLEPLLGSISNIKLEEKTVVSTVDLTEEEDLIDPLRSVNERHDKWVNAFQRLAKQYRESQLLLEKQQNQLISNSEKESVICLDSDSEEEEEISTAVSKLMPAIATSTQQKNSEDLFVDNYPLTNTPISCDSDLESLDAEDESDGTKISPRFLSSTLRTYQAKKSNMSETEDKSNSDADEHNKSQDMDKAYRRDSIHISSTPPERSQTEDDDGTDVQDEHDDTVDEEEETSIYSPLLTTNKRTEKEIFTKQIRPMGPYPTYNNMNGMSVFSQTLSRYPQQQQYKDKQYHSDSSETKNPKNQKKRVQFNTSPLGPTASSASQIAPLKSALQQSKYNDSDVPEYPHLRGSISSSCSNSTSSSIKQKEHLAAAASLFRNVLDRTSSVSSRSLTLPAAPSTARKKSFLPKNRPAIKQRRTTMGTRDDLMNSLQLTTEKEEGYSIIRNREILKDSHHPSGAPVNYEESSDDNDDVASDSNIIMDERCKNDDKLRKRCAVVIKPTKELIQYLRKRDEMYNEILQKQRRKLELRALEKQREKERKRLDGREEKREQTRLNNSGNTTAASEEMSKPSRNAILMSSESECETHFEMRTRKHKREHFKEQKPFNKQLEMAETTTTTLLSKIDAHLDKPASEKSIQYEVKKQQQENQANINGINEQASDISSEKGQTKLRELNYVVNIAQHLSPYQLDLSDSNKPPRTPSHTPEPPPLPPASQIQKDMEVPKEKVNVTEHLIIQSVDNHSEKTKPQLNNNDQEQQASTSYAHEPKIKNVAAIFKSSPCTNLLRNQNQLETNDNSVLNNSTANEINSKIQPEETLEQILEESISVLKPVTSPFNTLNESSSIQPETHSDSTIPLLIGNVESLNQFEQNDNVTMQKSDDKVHLLIKDTIKAYSDNAVLTENESLNKESNEGTNDWTLEQHRNLNRNEPIAVSSTTILNTVESSIMCASDLANTPDETEISQNLKASSAALSDISLESTISKHLSEIADPSPGVTDISDSFNESESPKRFVFQTSVISNTTAGASGVTEMSLSDLSFVMPTTQSESFNQLNCSLSTPTKLADVMSREEESANISTDDLNTPLKYAVQPELQSNTMPLKNTLDPDTDNNVTKFLDLILNKTVTDAESETRDKIIKELNALTTDTAASTSGMPESSSNNGIMPLECNLSEEGRNKSIGPVKCVDEKKIRDEKILEENADVLKKQINLNIGSCESHQTLEYSFESHIENKSCATDVADSKITPKEKNDSQTPSANNELNPPVENPKEKDCRELQSDIAATEFSERMSLISLSPAIKIKSPSITQSLNSKCRVRLKRINIDEQCKTSKKETWMTVPIANNYRSKCDILTGTTSAIKKSCLKYYNKHASEEDKNFKNLIDVATAKRFKYEIERSTPIEAIQTPTSQQPQTQTLTLAAPAAAALTFNIAPTPKSKGKPSKTVSFELPNLNEELRENTASNHKQKPKSHAGYYLKNSRLKKLLDNNLRPAETLEMFVNTINDSTPTPPPAEFNKKRSPIKNKCIAEDETPRPPPASTLMGTPPCKKTCTEKSRSQIISKCKNPSITSDITTDRIYTSSPLDQTLSEYDNNVDTVADAELILPSTTGSLRRKLKRPKKALTRPEPVDDISTDEISNQPECNAEDDTDVVVPNEGGVFTEELLPTPAANEHILEEIVSARPSHKAIRDDYMNIEPTTTVPVYLFNDESRDLSTAEPIQTTDITNVVDSSSYLNTSSLTATNNVPVVPPANTAAIGNLEKSMLSPSEHEVSSTQETFYQTPTKNKPTEIFGEKSSTSKEKGNRISGLMISSISKQKPEDTNFQNKDYQTSSTTCLLQNNQVDTTNHSPEMCTLALTATTTTTNMTSNRKLRKASTHDELLFNELQQQQLPSIKRKSTTAATTFYAESTSDSNSNAISKTKVESNNLDVKLNGSLAKAGDKLKKFLKEACKRDINQTTKEVDVGAVGAYNNSGGGGGSSPSTTTIINEEKLPTSKRKKLKSSKSCKNKSHSERSSKIVLKASKLTPQIPTNPLKITRPPTSPTPPTTMESKAEQQQSAFLDIPNAKLFIEKNNHHQHQHNHDAQYQSMTKRETNASVVVTSKLKKRSQTPLNALNEIVNTKPNKIEDSEMKEAIRITNSTNVSKEKLSLSPLTTKNKEKLKNNNNTNSSISVCANSIDNNLFLKDKYDLIKSKEKHHHDQQNVKEKLKDKTSSQSKATTSNNTRSLKSSTKEKIKGEKLKEKRKATEKSSIQQTDKVLQLNTSESRKKTLSFFSSTATPLPTTSFSSGNAKQSNSKLNKSSNSSSSSTTSAILKSKTNLPTTQLLATATDVASSQITAATPSTNNKKISTS